MATCVLDHVGVKAPGKPTMIVFLPLVRSAMFTAVGGNSVKHAQDATQIVDSRLMLRLRPACRFLSARRVLREARPWSLLALTEVEHDRRDLVADSAHRRRRAESARREGRKCTDSAQQEGHGEAKNLCSGTSGTSQVQSSAVNRNVAHADSI
jgi:hypothetical protein